MKCKNDLLNSAGIPNMNCTETQPLLSAYYDCELDRDRQARVAEHVADCESCRAALNHFNSLSKLTADQDIPNPPAALDWLQVQAMVAPKATPSRTTANNDGRRLAVRLAYLVAAVLLVTVGFQSYQRWFGSYDRHLVAADLGAYVRAFADNPDDAQQHLLVQYQGSRIDAREASNQYGFQLPLSRAPAGEFRLASLHLLRMPCCECVQAVCVRADGSKLAIFEYDARQPMKFGNHPETQQRCNGKACRLVEIGQENFAVDWEHNGRRFLVVGAKDRGEVERVVGWLSAPESRS